MRLLIHLCCLTSMILCAGCGSLVSRSNSSNANPVYAGTRSDFQSIANNHGSNSEIWNRAVWVLDVPFSLTADTLWLPFDLYDLSERRPTVDPLLGWKPVTSPEAAPGQKIQADKIPFNAKITAAVDAFIKKKKFKFGPQSSVALKNPQRVGSMRFYEDGTGRHAVEMFIPLDDMASHVATYILIFDKSDVLKKVIKYREYHGSMCMRSAPKTEANESGGPTRPGLRLEEAI